MAWKNSYPPVWRERAALWALNAFIVGMALSIPGLIAADIYWDKNGQLAIWAVLPFIIFMAG